VSTPETDQPMSDERPPGGNDAPGSRPSSALPHPVWEVILATAGITAILSLLHNLAGGISWVSANLGGLAALLFVYIATWRVEKTGASLEDFGISYRPLGRSLLWGLGAIVVVLGLFVAGYLFYYSSVCGQGGPSLLGALGRDCHRFAGVTAPLRLPKGFGLRAASELVVVALPEEMFYRGYVQTTLETIWPSGLRIGPGTLGWAALVQALLFGFGHFLVDFNPLRLAVALPALLFAYLRSASGGIGASVLFHAAANLVVSLLDATYFP